MSTAPSAGSTPLRSATSERRRRASGTPRVWMPTSASVGEVVRALDQLVREPRERPRQGICVENLARGVARG